MKSLLIDVDVVEIKTNTIVPADGSKSQLKRFSVFALRNITIKSGVFQNMNNLSLLELHSPRVKRIEKGAPRVKRIEKGAPRVKRIEKGAFKTTEKSDEKLYIMIVLPKWSGHEFEAGAFDGVQRNRVDITMIGLEIDIISEWVFESILKQNP